MGELLQEQSPGLAGCGHRDVRRRGPVLLSLWLRLLDRASLGIVSLLSQRYLLLLCGFALLRPIALPCLLDAAR